MTETFYDVMRRQGITRRSFLKLCSLTAAAMGLSPVFAGKISHAMKTSLASLCYGCMAWNAPAVPNPLFVLPTRSPRTLFCR